MAKSVRKSRKSMKPMKSIRGGGLRKKTKSLRLKSKRQRGSRKSSKRKNRSKKRQRGGSADTDTDTFIEIIELLKSLFDKINKGLQNKLFYPGKYKTLVSINGTINQLASVYKNVYKKELTHYELTSIRLQGELDSIQHVIRQMFPQANHFEKGGQVLPSAFEPTKNEILKLLVAFKTSNGLSSLQPIVPLLNDLNNDGLPDRMMKYIMNTNTTYTADAKAAQEGKEMPKRATPNNATTHNQVFIKNT